MTFFNYLNQAFFSFNTEMMIKRLLPFVFLVVFMSSYPLRAQQSEGKRPRIGYVFSGGGAKGSAHVGVLKVLEEVGLEPDYITGTSMGSIMGGLYSIGYTADELGKIVETADWGILLANQIPFDHVQMGRKFEYDRYILELPMYNGKPELPAGLIEGQKLSELFSELTWRQAGVDDFNDFPYPFVCIGTDILQGKKVEMNSGDLASAMRASMAIPSIFTAVQRDSTHILVDGGVMRNFPVQEAIDMGADIIIGVYVGFDSHMKPEQLRSLTSVITRTSLLSGAMDVNSQIPLVDHLILPDLEGYSTSSFTSGVEIMKRGEAAARAQIDVLRALADSINGLGPAPERKMLPKNDSIFIEDIKVLTQDESLREFVVARSGIETGEWLHPDQLNESIDLLFGTIYFDKVEYYFEKMDQGYRLVFRIKEKPPSTVGAALHYDNTFGPGIILNYSHNNLGLQGSKLGVSVDISENSQGRAYYDIHLGKKRTFLGAVYMTGEVEKLPFYSNGQDIGDYRLTRFKGGLGFRQSLGINSHVGADFYYNTATIKLASNIKEVVPEMQFLDKFVIQGPELAFVYELNTFNNTHYPTRGSIVSFIYRQAFSTTFITEYDIPDSIDVEDQLTEYLNPYWHFTLDLENYLPLGKKVSLNSEFALGLSDNEKPFPDNYYIGGYRYNLRKSQVPFAGLNSYELLHGNYIKGKLGVQLEPFSGLFINALANIIFVSDDITTLIDDIFEWSEDSHYIGAGAGLAYKTPIGPISVFLGSRTDAWNPIWYINLGFTFKSRV